MENTTTITIRSLIPGKRAAIVNNLNFLVERADYTLVVHYKGQPHYLLGFDFDSYVWLAKASANEAEEEGFHVEYTDEELVSFMIDALAATNLYL